MVKFILFNFNNMSENHEESQLTEMSIEDIANKEVMEEKLMDITYNITSIFDSLGFTKKLARENLIPLENVNDNIVYTGIKQVNKGSDDENILSFKDIVTSRFLDSNHLSRVENIKKEAAAITAMTKREEMDQIRKKKTEDYFHDMDYNIQLIRGMIALTNNVKEEEEEEKTPRKDHEKLKEEYKKSKYEGIVCQSIVSLSVKENILKEEDLNHNSSDDTIVCENT